MGHSPLACSLSFAFSPSRPQKGFQGPTTLAKEVAPMHSACLPFSSPLHVFPRPLPKWKGTGRHRALLLWNCSSTCCNSSLGNPRQQNLQSYQANSSFPHSCQQPGIPHCSGNICSSTKENSKAASVPRKGDVLLEHICSAPKLLLSYSVAQAWARAASVFWDITSLYQSSQECEDRGVPCVSSALPRTNERNNLAQVHTYRDQGEKTPQYLG